MAARNSRLPEGLDTGDTIAASRREGLPSSELDGAVSLPRAAGLYPQDRAGLRRAPRTAAGPETSAGLSLPLQVRPAGGEADADGPGATLERTAARELRGEGPRRTPGRRARLTPQGPLGRKRRRRPEPRAAARRSGAGDTGAAGAWAAGPPATQARGGRASSPGPAAPGRPARLPRPPPVPTAPQEDKDATEDATAAFLLTVQTARASLPSNPSTSVAACR